jgi:DNA mismatch repair protein MutS
LPQSVVDRAKEVLEALEKGERDGGKQMALIDDLPLFRAAPPAPATRTAPKPSELEARLRSIQPDELTPIAALRLVYDLKQML